ncbi:MAG: sulfotransferase family protein, partial [Nocardioidaceae bacterium]
MMQSEVPTGRNKSLLVVAGSGRSGTSLFTGLAGRLGLYIPQPEIKPDATNPRGFGEPRWVLAFHKEMLKSVDVSHDDARPVAWDLTAQVAERARARRRLRAWLEEQFAVSDRVVVKDPRLAPFLGLYRTVADDLSVQLCVVTMLRHPAETVRSKETYYGDHLGSTARMASWLNMMLSVEHATRDLPSAVIRFDDLLTQWRPTL